MPEEQIRDGISQKMRLKAALQPNYVLVDERSLEDMLRFLYEYSATLRYFDENNREHGTWQEFFPFPSDEALSDIKKFLENPASLSEDKAQKYQQPHFVLLLTFLQLLERVKRHLNGFSKKHLDFYYQDILQMQKKKARPDRVNVIVELSKQHESFLLPAGTEFYAGKDSEGKSLIYKTDENAQLNHARIAQLRAVYVDKQLIPIHESIQKAQEEYLNKDEGDKEKTSEGVFIEMLEVILGEPCPGEKLLKYPLDGKETDKNDMTLDLLNKLCKQLNSIIRKSKLTCDQLKKYDERNNDLIEISFSVDSASNKEMNELYGIARQIKSFFYISAVKIYSLRRILNKSYKYIKQDEWKMICNILSLAYQEKTSSIHKKEFAKILVSKEELGFIARRKRELQEDIIAEKEEWQGLYKINAVRKVTIRNNTGEQWKTFGQFSSENIEYESAEFGLAVSSPVLLLSDGERKITLTFQVKDNLTFQPEMFRVSVSTEGDWIEVKPKKISDEKWEIRFFADQESIAAPTSGPFKGVEWPIIKIMFDERMLKKNPDKKEYNWMEHYQQLKLQNLLLSDIQIDIDVIGFSGIKTWNDLQLLDNKKPFEPFGPKPIVGSRFYLSSPELSEKRISSLQFNTEWNDLESLTPLYYKNYKKDINGQDSFCIEIGCNGTDAYNSCLFRNPISIDKTIEKQKIIYWKLQEPDFQHSVYSSLAAQKAIELAVAIANKTPEIIKEDYQLNPPFTPVIKKLTLNYKATAKLSDNPNDIQLFHIHPFGYADVTPVKEDGKIIKYPSFLPQYGRAGELYIGLENLKPPQHLSMFFQMAEGSADAEMNPSPVYWDYLDGNEWQPLENGGVLQDGTRGLINSGIIKFALPAAKKPSTLLPPELYWLRASVRKRPNSVCDTVAIHTQAVSATLVDNDNAPDHFSKPLAEGSIKKLLRPHPAIKAVHQPYTSFGGKTAEEDELFYTRVSERLRHKQRALTVWDYEHLVLERFPQQIYKVKCIPANASKPGTVEIVVIPDIRNRLPADPFEPKAPVNVLAEIQEYIQGLSPDSANIVVKNARYVPFKIRMGVRFQQGYEEGYHANRLQDELNRFLAPWAYTEGADIVFGGKIYASSIINFVERLPYVDYIAQFNFFPIELRDGENSISAKEAADVLVPERKHFIDAIPEGGYQFGINHMRIGLDFQVADNNK